MQEYCIKYFKEIYGYLLDWGDSNKYPKHMFYEVIRKQHKTYLIYQSAH